MVSSIVLSAELNKHKKNRVLRQARGHYLHVLCGECSEPVICYSHSQTKIFCKNCSSLLVKPTGGFAELMGKTKSKKAESTY